MTHSKYHRIGIYCNRRKTEALELAKDVFRSLSELGAEPLLSREIEKEVGIVGQVGTRKDLCASAQALIVLGGDGTLLMAARDNYQHQTPIMGVNLGYLGFLTETTTDFLNEQIKNLVEGNIKISERMVLEARIERLGGKEEEIFESPVINEVLICRRGRSRILDLRVNINGEFLTRYRADGILVSTPTGSTGHSLSSGGPILKPEMRAILLTPICAHTLATRTLIVNDRDIVEIFIQPEDQDVSLTVDGQIEKGLAGGDRVQIGKGKHIITLVRSSNLSFYEVLRKKLYLGGIPTGN